MVVRIAHTIRQKSGADFDPRVTTRDPVANFNAVLYLLRDEYPPSPLRQTQDYGGQAVRALSRNLYSPIVFQAGRSARRGAVVGRRQGPAAP